MPSWLVIVPGDAPPPAPPPPAPRPARSLARVVLAAAQPLLRSPMTHLSGTMRVGDEDLVEHRVAGHLIERADVARPAWCMSIAIQLMPWCFGRVGVGASEQHAHVGGLAHRRPHLLAVDDPLVAVLDRLGGETGEVRAGAGLGEQLAPRLLAGDDVAHERVDLLLAAVGRDRRRGQQQAETRRAHRARRTPRSRWRSPRRRRADSRGRTRCLGSVGAAQPAVPSFSHHSPTVRSGSQFSSSQARSSSRISVRAVCLRFQ